MNTLLGQCMCSAAVQGIFSVHEIMIRGQLLTKLLKSTILKYVYIYIHNFLLYKQLCITLQAIGTVPKFEHLVIRRRGDQEISSSV